MFRQPFVKSSLFLAVFALVLPVFCFGQAEAGSVNAEVGSGSKEKGKVKVVRTYTSEAGSKKLRPFNLTRELYFDTLNRVQKEVEYTYLKSVFGVDSTITVQEYTYAQGSNTVSFLKKTFLSVENRERYKNEVGYEFDQDGVVSKMLVYHPDGTVKEAANQLSLVANNLKSHARGTTVPQPVDTGKGFQSSPAQTHYSAGSNYGNLLSPQKEQEEIVTTKEAIANGYVVREVTESGRVLSEKRVLLNDKGFVSHIVTSESEFNGKLRTVSIENYVHDSAGREIERATLNPDGKLLVKYAHTYNDQGKLEKSVVSEKKNRVKKVLKFEYEYH